MYEGFARPEQRCDKLSAELVSGRLPWMAIAVQDTLAGSVQGDWALYSDTPLRCDQRGPVFNTLPEHEGPPAGFQGPVGDQPLLVFWGPMGSSKIDTLRCSKGGAMRRSSMAGCVCITPLATWPLGT